MDLIALIVEAIKFIFPAYCANAAPVIGKGKKPMDFGRDFLDQKRIFGSNKTFRGFFTGLLIGSTVGLVDCLLFGYPLFFALATPFGALLGDLGGAFIKRRLSLVPGALLPVVDQIDFVVGALVFALPFMAISLQLVLAVLLITPPLHLLTNYGAYKLKLKKNPW